MAMMIACAAAGLLARWPHACMSMASSSSPLIIHEGDGWIVANKPAGVIVHDGEGSLIELLADAGYSQLNPCHRLDAETSGAMLLATRAKAGEITACLAGATKLYKAAIKGEIDAKKARGVWKQSLSPKAEGRKNPRGLAAKRLPATTAYSVVGYNGYVSLVDFTLSTTGRTHQIRKHAAANGHPIAGDARYAEPWAANQMIKRYQFEGMALHAAALAITIDGADHLFEAPLPRGWDGLIDSFGRHGEAWLAAPTRLRAAADAGADAGGARLGGVCTSWNVRKGFGWIKGDGSVENVYVHQRAVLADGFRALKEGERVEYEISEMADGKLEAVHVTGPKGVRVIGQPKLAPPVRMQVARRADDHADAASTAGKRKPRLATGAAKKYKKAKDAARDASKPLPPGAYAPRAQPLEPA